MDDNIPALHFVIIKFYSTKRHHHQKPLDPRVVFRHSVLYFQRNMFEVAQGAMTKFSRNRKEMKSFWGIYWNGSQLQNNVTIIFSMESSSAFPDKVSDYLNIFSVDFGFLRMSYLKSSHQHPRFLLVYFYSRTVAHILELNIWSSAFLQMNHKVTHNIPLLSLFSTFEVSFVIFLKW